MTESTASSPRRRYLSPATLVTGLLLFEVALFLYERSQAFSPESYSLRGWFLAVAVDVLALTILALWLLTGWVKGRPAAFSLRAAALLVAAIAVPWGWFAEERRLLDDAKRAAGRIYRSGGEVSVAREKEATWSRTLLGFDYARGARGVRFARDVDLALLPRLPRVTEVELYRIPLVENWRFLQNSRISSLRFTETPVKDRELEAVMKAPRLQQLSLIDAEITDEGLAILATGKQLITLDLSATKITDEGLKSLADHPGLANLYLSRTQVSDDGIDHLRKLTTLAHIKLAGTQVTDRGLAALGELPNLHSLDISRTSVTGSGLRGWSDKPLLTRIYANETDWSDEGVGNLARYRHLRELDLSKTKVTAAGIRPLTKVNHLRSLLLYDTGLGHDDVAPIRIAVPTCTVNVGESER